MIKGFAPLAAVLLLGLSVGACSSYPKLGASVSDVWPRWAGGEPSDLPPRRGEPGYEEFIAHKGTPADSTTAAAPTAKGPAQAGQPVAGGPVAPSAAGERTAVQGGLY